jgi:hypothetical protein
MRFFMNYLDWLIPILLIAIWGFITIRGMLKLKAIDEQ